MPALQNTFLFVEPAQHFLQYGSLVLHDIVSKNRKAGQIITELIGDDANPDRVKQELTRITPIVFCGLGHGNPTTFTVECTAKLFDTSSSDLNLLADKVCSLCSCLTAQLLGPAIIDAGAVAYTGYSEEFWFYTADVAGTTRAVQSPFLAEFQFVASLLNGKSTGGARADQLARYDEEINFWTVGDGKDNADAMELSRILEINKGISVFLGEGGIAPSSPQILMAGTSSLLWIAEFLILATLAYQELKRKSY